ncbi:MAG: CDP-glycerol glycerophosphotransferase family protein [Actinomycetota bacterium]|nr:CDP-glycerol glycerophosphotransferase family protein [Actinomycetota bacterium]
MANEPLTKTIKRAVKRPVRFLAKDWALGVAFPHEYRKAAAQTKVDPKKILFVDIKSSTMPDAFSYIFSYLQDNYDLDVRFVGLAQNENIGWGEYYKRCLALCRNLASACVVFLADACDVISCLPLRPETKVVQLWHACGAFKKWGMSTSSLLFGNTRRQIERHPFYKNLSLVTVSSPEVAWAYREAMDLESQPEVVKATGVSRTDRFFDDTFLEDARAELASAVPGSAGKKVLLYAPTFRGHVGEAEGPDFIDFNMMRETLADEWVLLVKHHPFVKNPPTIPENCKRFAFMVPEVPTECLMATADAMVTDYSSVVFEYSLFERPVAFLSPDVDSYCDWRGFYYPYHEMTPGPVLGATHELAEWVKSLSNGFDPAAVRAFREKFMSACDGHATERIVKDVLGDLSAFAKPPTWERMAARIPDGPDISIIVPAYNAEKTLARALDSVLMQTYPLDRIELIVVDDCSSDGTEDVLQGYAEEHPYLIKAMQTPSHSGSPAEPRNIGLAAAHGEYAFFLDADDWLGPESIERMLGHALDWGSDVMLVKLRGEGGRDVPKSMFTAIQPDADKFRSKVMWTFAPLKLFRCTLVSNLRFPDFMPEDISFVLRAYLRAGVVSVASDYAYYHVAAEQGDANASVTTWDDVESNLRAYADIFGLIETYIPKGKDREAILKRLFGRDICRTLERIGIEQNAKVADCQLERLLNIAGAHYNRKVLSALPTRERSFLATVFEDSTTQNDTKTPTLY